ncbi:MAG: fibrobacter succinogenes major paralogous domain-containing protein [Fibrobacter sp.]|nr:fibrobacter succinogenes major paralogous domain-containing protein [Fibrobacter sp.]
MKLNKLFNVMAGSIRHLSAFVAFAVVLTAFVACSDSDKTAGGTTEDAGVIADLNVAGLTQKGPFAKGSAVTVQGIDCQTMELTGEKFTGSVKSDKGDFEVKDVNLSSTCAAFEVKGYYFNEVTGKKSSDKLTLHALTDLKDRKNVNINLLTQLEYERVMNLVTEEKMSFAEAKTQAEKEVLAAFSVKAKDGEFALSEDLNILEKGDDNAALLAVSVMMQSDLKVAKLAERVNDVAADIAKDGSWDDDKTKTEIAEWAATADKNGEFENVGKNIEKWGGSDEVSAFETVVENFADSKKGASSSSATSANLTGSSTGSVTLNSSSSKNVLSSISSSVIASEAKQSSSSRYSGLDPESSSGAVNSYLNPNIDYGEMTDSRDGQVYRTVKIGNQVWMAENLNYEIDSSFCYNDSAEYCAKYGRLYTWATAVGNSESECGYGKICSLPSGNIQGVCPSGWHMPSKAEWDTLFNAVGGQLTAGKMLKSTSDWIQDGNGTDEFGFSVLPSGYVTKGGSYSYAKYYAYLLSSTEFEEHDGAGAYVATMSSKYDYVNLDYTNKSYGFSVRCLKNGSETVPESSSGSAESSSSVTSSSSVALATPCKTETEDNCDYGTLTDSRDGQVYKTVKIGDQVWMAQNLNYAYLQPTVEWDSSSFCYNDSLKYCEKYGRLYTWAVAMDSVGAWSEKSKGCGDEKNCSPTYPVQGICPEGWHLPDTTEWNVLFTAVGGASSAKINLKTNSEGWGRNDSFGFSAVPGGYRNSRGGYKNADELIEFWSSAEYTSSGARTRSYHILLYYDDDEYNQLLYNDYKAYARYVRCLKD